MRAYFGRRYRFSASHRLHSDALSAEENRAVYGKCNNPHGHGHNYILEVRVGGEVDAETGKLDAVVRKEVLDVFDHTNLNAQECFRDRVPTTENVCREIFRRMREGFDAADIVAVRVEETSNNSFEIRED